MVFLLYFQPPRFDFILGFQIIPLHPLPFRQTVPCPFTHLKQLKQILFVISSPSWRWSRQRLSFPWKLNRARKGKGEENATPESIPLQLWYKQNKKNLLLSKIKQQIHAENCASKNVCWLDTVPIQVQIGRHGDQTLLIGTWCAVSLPCVQYF